MGNGPSGGPAGLAHGAAPPRKALQLKPVVPRTINSTYRLRCSLNLLPDQLKLTQDNRMWVSDITGLSLTSGAWVYLCACQNGCTKHVVGWQVRADRPEGISHQRLASGSAGSTVRPIGYDPSRNPVVTP